MLFKQTFVLNRRIHLAFCVIAIYGAATFGWVAVKSQPTRPKATACKFADRSIKPAVNPQTDLPKAPVPAGQEGILSIVPADPCDKSAPFAPAAREYQESAMRFAKP